MALPTRTWGMGPTIGLIHGFTQSSATWAPVAERLQERWQLVAVDAPGHGASAGVAADLWGAAELVGAAIGPATYIGYSMGGRIALHLALARPDLVGALVLVSATAGIDDPGERAARRAADAEMAGRIEADGVENFVRWWLGRPLFASLPSGAAALGSRLEGTAEGLASSLRLAGTGSQEPLWDRLGELAQLPVLAVAGALDPQYGALAARLAGTIGPSATVVTLDGVGHACQLEDPDAFSTVVDSWLTATREAANRPAASRPAANRAAANRPAAKRAAAARQAGGPA